MSAPTEVLIAEDIHGGPIERLADRWSIGHHSEAWRDPVELVSLVRGAKALVVRNRTQVTRQLLENAPDLRIIARVGVGLDNIDVAAADDHNVVVSAPLGANATSVAEHTIGLALSLARRTVALDAACREGQWTRLPGAELSGGTWGLLGAGATARATGRIAGALGMRVIAYDPFIDPGQPELAAAGIRLLPLMEVLAGSDVLSCHLPATQDTCGLIDAALITQMPSHAILVNVGRGEVINEDDLADALEGGGLSGAGLDVRASEPPVPGRLEKLDSVIVTPHIAGITQQSQHRILDVLCTDIDAVMSGRIARSAVGSVNGASE